MAVPVEQREQDLAAALFPTDGLVERVIEWAGDNLEPSEVFPREKLEEWAKLNGYELLPT